MYKGLMANPTRIIWDTRMHQGNQIFHYGKTGKCIPSYQYLYNIQSCYTFPVHLLTANEIIEYLMKAKIFRVQPY